MTFRVCRSMDEWLSAPHARARTVATVGNFDGVHLGHRKILARVADRARATESLAAAVTFDPHPLKVLRPEVAPPLVTTLEQRLGRFAEAGLDVALVLPFTVEFSRLSPEEFVDRILARTLAACAVLVGENFRFGYRQTGDVALLTELGQRFDFAVEIVQAVRMRGELISSTLVRQAIGRGRVQRAGRMLGRPFALTGEIQPGTGQGRRLVAPTLNLACEQELVPARGVYATESVVDGKLYRSATNVGVRPTFGGQSLTVESHLLDFDRELTSGRMEVRFWKRLREEKKFGSVAELRAQVLRDIARSRGFFARLDRRRPVSAAS